MPGAAGLADEKGIVLRADAAVVLQGAVRSARINQVYKAIQ